ncbi:hypothetical protein [Dactylosporangium sp. NPDC000521]|uniref:hypothetical protein n=1 Tax=Dactylosporangium sp. NPDC000521 TaxID=3363975 RepID=UPI00367D60A9
MPVIDAEEPDRPAWLTPERDEEPAGPGSRQTLLLVAGGAAILVLVAGVAAFALLGSSSEPSRPRPRSAAAEPVVAVTASTTPAEAPSAAAAEPSATPKASPAKPHVTAAQISVEPASVTGPCPRSTKYVKVKVTVTITVSSPDVRLRYTVDGGKEHGATPRSRTYTDTWEAEVRRAAGTSTSTLQVIAPSTASDTATFTYTCN